jgi:hypothetical protein
MMQRSHFTSFIHSLVFRSGVLKISSRGHAAAAMLYATWGNRRPLGPRVDVIVVIERVHNLLPCKVLPLALELCLGSLQVHLSTLQAVRLLQKVGRAAAGTPVRWHEPGCLLSKTLVIDVVAHARRGIVVDVIRVVLQAIP